MPTSRIKILNEPPWDREITAIAETGDLVGVVRQAVKGIAVRMGQLV